jgi:hypothetical protein
VRDGILHRIQPDRVVVALVAVHSCALLQLLHIQYVCQIHTRTATLTHQCARAVTNQYVGNVYKAYVNPNGGFPYYPQDVQGASIVSCMRYTLCALVLFTYECASTDYDLEQRIWLNFVVQIIMVFGYRFLAWIYMSLFIRGKK